MDTLEDVLEHYGIRGMKWGVRRSRAQIDADSADKAVTRALNEQVKKNRGSTDSLSNTELQQVITRMNLEQQYSNLTAKEGVKSKSKGEQWVMKRIENIGTKQFENAVNRTISSQVNLAIDKQLEKQKKS